MQDLKILNKKQIKEILAIIKKQWGCSPTLDYVFLMNEKNRLYIVNKDINRIDLSKLRINSLGMYFGELRNNELRLTIEGSQLIGKHAKENIINLNDKEARLWLKGFDLDKKIKEKGFAIIKHNDDFLGTGKYGDNKIFNYVPKTRRIMASD